MKNLRSLFTIILMSSAGYLSAEKDQPKKTDCKTDEKIETSVKDVKTDLMTLPMPSGKPLNEITNTRWEDSLLDSNLNIDEPEFEAKNNKILPQDQSIVSSMKK